jgi:hypothetical protein
MLPEMDVNSDRSMTWFFNQYVYGTALPTQKLAHTISTEGGQTTLELKVTQSGVPDGFVMLAPIYVEFEDGRVVRLGAATLRGNTTVQQKVNLGQLPVRRAHLNYYYDGARGGQIAAGASARSFFGRLAVWPLAVGRWRFRGFGSWQLARLGVVTEGGAIRSRGSPARPALIGLRPGRA